MKLIFSYYLKPYYVRMAVGFLLKFSGTLMDLFLPWTLAYMIDTVIPENRGEEILLWGLFMILCSILAVAFSIIANRMASKVASCAMETVREDLFKKVMSLSSSQIDSFTTPSLISRLTSDTYNVHQMISRVQRLGVRAPILLIGGITMTMALDPVLSCILLGVLPLLTLVVVLVSRKTIPMFAVFQDRVDGFVRLIREDIAGIRVIKALSKEPYERERFDEANREVVDWEKRATITTSITNPVMNILLNLGLVAVIIAGAIRVNLGISQVGKILAFMTYFTIILNALMSISRLFIMISKAAASANRIRKVLEAVKDLVLMNGDEEEEEEERGRAANEEMKAGRGVHVEFDHVFFSYDKVEDNLQDVTFRLKRGETLGIIGATGAGKTTVVNLMMRFYDVDKGAVRIDGRDVRTMGHKELRRRFGIVLQNDTIFEDTIMENISMGRELDSQAVMEAALYARAGEFVKEKGGLLTKLDIRGANLSGGQKQRILIARALAAHPDILILDDSSSALDYKTDAALRKELREHFAQTTCVIITQRISSIMAADHIMVLDEGQIIGYGSHGQLMESCEIYREIGKSQMEMEEALG